MGLFKKIGAGLKKFGGALWSGVKKVGKGLWAGAKKVGGALGKVIGFANENLKPLITTAGALLSPLTGGTSAIVAGGVNGGLEIGNNLINAAKTKNTKTIVDAVDNALIQSNALIKQKANQFAERKNSINNNIRTLNAIQNS